MWQRVGRTPAPVVLHPLETHTLVGTEKTYLFAVGTPVDAAVSTRAVQHENGEPRLRVFALPLNETTLRSRVSAFRALLARRGAAATQLARLEKSAAELFADLPGPARSLIQTSDRIVVSPDGPLHLLPLGLTRAFRSVFFGRSLNRV